jgi:dipeptidyl aminopeptidase/acylaminoacyl peptidase
MHLLRTKFKNEILAEFLPPKKHSQDVIILCDGMPTVPSKKKLIEKLSKKGFWVFHPRYRGTWESNGGFLDHSPEDDILDLIDELPKGFTTIWEKKEFHLKPKRIFVIGASFGGTAALLTSKDKRVTKVIAISPVIDWTVESPEEPMDLMEQITKDGYGGGYRFKHDDWLRLSRGEFFQPKSVIKDLDPKKIFLLHAEDDKAVPIEPAKEFVKELGCQFIFFKTGGHDLYKKIQGFRTGRKLLKFLNE